MMTKDSLRLNGSSQIQILQKKKPHPEKLTAATKPERDFLLDVLKETQTDTFMLRSKDKL